MIQRMYRRSQSYKSLTKRKIFKKPAIPRNLRLSVPKKSETYNIHIILIEFILPISSTAAISPSRKHDLFFF